MTTPRTGGPAFPDFTPTLRDGLVHQDRQPGMTLLQWYAGQALAEAMRTESVMPRNMAERAYDPDSKSDMAEMKENEEWLAEYVGSYHQRAAALAVSMGEAMIAELDKRGLL